MTDDEMDSVLMDRMLISSVDKIIEREGEIKLLKGLLWAAVEAAEINGLNGLTKKWLDEANAAIKHHPE